MNDMTLADWLRNNGYEASVEAEQIRVGQNLTQEEAIRVRRMLNRAYLDSEGFQVLGDWVYFKGKGSYPFFETASVFDWSRPWTHYQLGTGIVRHYHA